MSESTPCPELRFGDEIYFHDPGFISWRIRAKSHGPFNHAAYCMNGSVATEAKMIGGLVETEIAKLIVRPCIVLRPQNSLGCDFVFTDWQKTAAREFWLQERGSGYDLKAIAGFMFLSWRNTWQSDEQWFCSEWNTAIANRAGVRAFNGLHDQGSIHPSARAVSPALRPIWHRLPEYLTKHMDLNGVPHA
jgi:hypothetical protein